MTISLSLHTQPDVPLEAELISPDKLAGLTTAEIEKQTVEHGNQKTTIADFFTVAGEKSDSLVLEGDLSKIKHIGSGMSFGKININGDVGAHLGTAMSGGEIVVEGNVGDWLAPEMLAGRVEVKGNAGHMVGSAYRGSPAGILGGEIIIHGNARNEVGHAMRNGMIVIGGDSGDFTGVNMLAGTIIVLGELGIRTGAGLRRGSVVCMKNSKLLPTFSYSCVYQPTYLRLYLLYLQSLGLGIREEQIMGHYERWCGDIIEFNRGEILLYHE
ncbi:MAG: formylmethanofuran dehydrogenase subunit C [Gammaproteobacteria bacterium]|jgi:formylmethanofuran dehydrogenase subunit C|nr:formylmethanofuran dehydrogenase subunit C [Gammaproteobacteria bacterium]